MNNIRGHKGERKVCGSVQHWVLTRYFVGLVLVVGVLNVFGVFGIFGVLCGGSVFGACAYATDTVDYSPAYIGESTVRTCPEGLLVTTRIVLDRNHAQVHISLPPSADTSTFTFEASGRRIVGIEEVWPEGVGPKDMGLEGVGPVMVVYFDADAIPNTEKARTHIYRDAPPVADGEDIESVRPVMNMVNLSATYSYVIPDSSVLVISQ
ncbi:MAG: hypothetical protein R3Y11_11330 [Pseudomonadota bacterium]